MRSSRWLLLASVAVSLVGLPLIASDAAAFNKGWLPMGYINVLSTETVFWDDVPSGTAGYAGMEAGLFAFVTNSASNETVYFSTITGLPVSSSFNILEVRAAAGDYSMFRVGYGTTTGACTVYPTALTFVGTMGGGPYLTKAFVLPTNTVVRRICLYLTDNPDAVAAGRAKAMIDHIRLRTSAGATGWFEFFSGGP